MAVDRNKLEDLLKQLPEELQNEVIRYAESLVGQNSRRTGGTVETKSARPAGTGVGNKGPSSVESFFGIWESGDPHSADNERIDADLAKAYINSHKTE